MRPQDDLYRFVNGGWIDRTVIPDERVTFTAATEVAEAVDADLRAIIEAIAEMPGRRPGSPLQQIGDLYTSLMDERAIEERGAAPLAPVLQRIDAIRTAADLAREAGLLSSTSTAGPFFTSVGADPSRPGVRIVHLSQGGILLPDRSYYLDDDEHLADIRRQYRAYLERIFGLIGREDAASTAAAVFALETELARAFWPVLESRSPGKTANPLALRRMNVEMPGFDWMAWARPQGIDPRRDDRRRAAVVFPRVRGDGAAHPARHLEGVARRAVRHRDGAVRQPGHRRCQVRVLRPGAHRAGDAAAAMARGVSMVNGSLGDAVGRLYVEKHFSPASRARVQRMVDHLVRAFGDGIRESDWMSSQAKAEGLAKLATLTRKIGYPDTWRDYRGLVVAPDDLVGNIARSQQFENAYRMARVERPARSRRVAGSAADRERVLRARDE